MVVFLINQNLYKTSGVEWSGGESFEISEMFLQQGLSQQKTKDEVI